MALLYPYNSFMNSARSHCIFSLCLTTSLLRSCVSALGSQCLRMEQELGVGEDWESTVGEESRRFFQSFQFHNIEVLLYYIWRLCSTNVPPLCDFVCISLPLVLLWIIISINQPYWLIIIGVCSSPSESIITFWDLLVLDPLATAVSLCLFSLSSMAPFPDCSLYTNFKVFRLYRFPTFAKNESYRVFFFHCLCCF